jgi:purine nucleoside phosphorylase
MEPAYCPSTTQVIAESAKALKLKIHPAVTCVTIEGPRFSSLSESKLYRSWGADIVNMTSVPEVMQSNVFIKARKILCNIICRCLINIYMQLSSIFMIVAEQQTSYPGKDTSKRKHH